MSTKKMILVLAFLCISLQNYAYDFEVTFWGETLYFNITSEGIPNDPANEVKETLQIPSATCEFTYKSVDVVDGELVYNKDCEYNAFLRLPSIVVYNNKRYFVNGYGAHAFENCETVKYFSVGFRPQYAGSCAFKNCKSLGENVSEESLGYNQIDAPIEIGDSAYYGCENLHMVMLWPAMKSIGKHAFYGCTGLYEVYCWGFNPLNIPVGEEAFYHQTEENLNCKLFIERDLHITDVVKQTYPWSKFQIEEMYASPNGVEDVEVSQDAPVEYYNLQGVRLAQPEAGQVVVKRQGGSATKMIVK